MGMYSCTQGKLADAVAVARPLSVVELVNLKLRLIHSSHG